jgi:hypothetical protein
MIRRAALLALLAASCARPQPCPEPLVECNGQCVDVQSNRFACGGCGRACNAGDVCVGANCTPDTRGPCADRTGGAFVTFGVCGSAVKAWIRRAAFIDEAASYVGTTAVPRTPLLAVSAGTDCDLQWSWTIDDVNAAWVTSVTNPSACDLCPSDLEAEVRASTLPPSASWCPTPASSLVLSVERR